ncbi:hypothetical protein AWENTII_011242 [Aspergillus wentii]
MASQVAIITGGDTFRSVFTSNGRLDSVFANAGVIERTNFFAASESDEPPPKPDLRVLDIDLKSVVLTSYLAQHYFRRSPGHGKGAILVITASCGGGGGVYPSWSVPLYSAAKRFMRSIVPNFALDGIRVNAICPSAVQTNFLDEAA